ncbi:uncharacterized protein N7500_007281 [Penicillium coprophilum]|uniref:uncharacterized protein n=1 Tax=Penicillium coprophilum TaxID=36646 RepID=UPI0023922D4B|nr:uncharacterized protein N7500_007281 [Penicillium coprophilum]KAJ5165451.1 hypothetical protein N7500_007281 [Penicillium coprophilum]
MSDTGKGRYTARPISMFVHDHKSLATQDLDTAGAGRRETFGFRFTALDLGRRQLPRWELLGDVTQPKISVKRGTVAFIP